MAVGHIFMANPAEAATLADRHREPVFETAPRLMQELLQLRPEGTSSDHWLSSICGLTHAMAEVATIAGGLTYTTPRSTPPAGQPFFPLA
jgi:hypothetical protein